MKERMHVVFSAEIWRNTDEDSIDSAKARLLRAFEEATYSSTIVKFEIWGFDTQTQTPPFLPAEAAVVVNVHQ